MRLPLSLLLLALVGCAERWERPGATEQEAEAAQNACAALALAKMPPYLVTRQILGYSQPGRTECWGTGARRMCRSTRGRYEPTRYEVEDLNGPTRNAMRNACLTEAGWRYAGLRPLRRP